MKLRLALWSAIASLTGALSFAPIAQAAPVWAPAADASVTPGVVTVTGNSLCTANFVFYDSADNVYLGQAAHCSSTSPSDQIDGCNAGSLPVGTRVFIQGASRPGTMVYNSWLTMQEKGETDGNVCTFNDFALVQLDPADYGVVNPSVPHWGGPTGLATSTAPGEKVVGYGHSPLRLGEGLLNATEGMSLGQDGNGWSHNVTTLLPGIPGDSGGGLMDSQGRAFGTLSTLALFPNTLSNGVGDLSRELEYMRANSPYDVTLAQGTEPFRSPVFDLGKVLGSLLNSLLGGGG